MESILKVLFRARFGSAPDDRNFRQDDMKRWSRCGCALSRQSNKVTDSPKGIKSSLLGLWMLKPSLLFCPCSSLAIPPRTSNASHFGILCKLSPMSFEMHVTKLESRKQKEKAAKQNWNLLNSTSREFSGTFSFIPFQILLIYLNLGPLSRPILLVIFVKLKKI